MPDWISHVAFVKEDRVVVGHKESYVDSDSCHKKDALLPPPVVKKAIETGKLLVDMRNVRVAYQEREVCISYYDATNLSHKNRQVLKSIHWKIRAGERWHLRGANGTCQPYKHYKLFVLTTICTRLRKDHPSLRPHGRPSTVLHTTTSKIRTHPLRSSSFSHTHPSLGVSHWSFIP